VLVSRQCLLHINKDQFLCELVYTPNVTVETNDDYVNKDVTGSINVSIYIYIVGWLIGFMVFNATFNNISAISWRSVLLVEDTGGPGENHRPLASD